MMADGAFKTLGLAFEKLVRAIGACFAESLVDFVVILAYGAVLRDS
jgi:hypothetical protein